MFQHRLAGRCAVLSPNLYGSGNSPPRSVSGTDPCQ